MGFRDTAMRGDISMKKKGIAPIIAVVMIMALAVTLGTFVTIWYTKASEAQTKTIIEKYGGVDECADVRFDVSFNYTKCYAVIYNLGTFTIGKVKVDRYFKNGYVPQGPEIWETGRGSEICAEGGLIPKNGCAIPMNSSILSKIQFTPIITSGNSLISCVNEKEFKPEGGFSGC